VREYATVGTCASRAKHAAPSHRQPAYNASMFGRIWIIIKHTYLSYVADNAGQLAASISYFVLFSVVPLAILAVSVFGLFLGSQDSRQTVVDHVIEVVPFSDTEGRQQIQDALVAVNRVSAPFAALGVIVTLWTASSVFASIRKSLNIVWDTDEHRPFFQAKLIDFLQIGLLLLVLFASVLATAIIRTARIKSAEQFGPLVGQSPLWEAPALLVPAAVTFLTFFLIYHVVPASRPHWRDVLPGALVATVAFEALKNLFAIYVAYVNNYDVVYGSLAGVLLFLLFTYLTANVLMVGAEVGRTVQRYRAHEFDAEMAAPQPPVHIRVWGAVRSLFVRAPGVAAQGRSEKPEVGSEKPRGA